MIVLALELSTDTGSLCLAEGDRVLFEQAWTEERPRRQPLYAVLHAAVASGRIALPSVELFAVGVGPGAFAGVRASVAAACAMALPGGRRVCGVSSSAALAWDVLAETGADRVTVVGDARRNQLWVAEFERDDEGPHVAVPWLLADGTVRLQVCRRTRRYGSHPTGSELRRA